MAFVLISVVGSLLASLSAGSALGGPLTLAHYVNVLRDPAWPRLMGDTVIEGTGTVAVMLLFALPLAWLLARTDFGGKTALFSLLTATLAIPAFITAMAYVFLFNPTAGIINRLVAPGAGGHGPFDVYTLPWLCFLQGVVLTPPAVFMMLPSLRNLDATLEESALVSGVPRWRTLRGVTLPLAAPAVLAVALFFFVIAIEIFDFVGVLGGSGRIDVLALAIYNATNPAIGLPDYGRAGALGICMAVLTGGAIALYVHFVRRSQRYAVVTGRMRQAPPQRLGHWTWAAWAFASVWAALAVVVPVLTLAWSALLPYLQPPSAAALRLISLHGFAEALGEMGVPALHTLEVMVGAGAFSVVLSACLSWVCTRDRGRLGSWLDTVVFLSPAVPGIVAAVAFQYAGILTYHLLPLYGTVWLVALAMGTRMLAFCTRSMNGAGLQIHRELDEAAYASGLPARRVFGRIYLPLLLPALFYSSLMVGMLSARELTLPIMMNASQVPLLSTLVFELQQNGYYDTAGAVGLITIVALVGLAVLAQRWTRAGAGLALGDSPRTAPRPGLAGARGRDAAEGQDEVGARVRASI